jgi:hypothetical protein
MHGLNIREPYATLIAMGIKKTETRSYTPPANLIGSRIALIATSKDESCIVGTAVLRGWMEYESMKMFANDYQNHRIPAGSKYDWDGSQKFGWFMSEPFLLREHVPAPKSRGIVWAKKVDLESCCA